MIDKYNIPFSNIQAIKDGQHYITEKGEKILNKKLTLDAHLPRSYAYCSDTLFSSSLVNYIENVDLLYYDATFHSDLSKRAKSTFHSTCKEAGILAKEANVKKLLLGHFSPRYKELNVLKLDAQSLFKNTLIVNEGGIYKIKKTFK